MYVSWSEARRVTLLPDEAEEWRRDPEAFGMRHVSGRIGNMELRTAPDGFTELAIEYQPIALESCEDCLAEGLTPPARATEKHRRNGRDALICLMHSHRIEMMSRPMVGPRPAWVDEWAREIGVTLP